MGRKRSTVVGVVLGVAAAVALLRGAVWVAPLTVRGDGWPTGTVRVDQALVGNPALYEGTVAASNGHRWRGFDIGSGEEVWRTERCIGPEGPVLKGTTDSLSPTVVQEGPLLVVRCSGDIRALDLRTGAFLWDYDPGRQWTILRVGGGRIAMGLDEHADVVDLHTGELLFQWQGEHVEDHSIVVAVNRDGIFISEDDQVIALDPDGRERWRDSTALGATWASDAVLVSRDRIGPLYFDAVTGEVLGDFGTSSESQNGIFVAGDGHEAVLARIDETAGVFGFDLARFQQRWHRSGARFLVAGPHHIAIDAGGTCQVLRITDGKHVGNCSQPGWNGVGVGFHDERVAVIATSPSRRGSTIVVRDL